MHVLQPVQLVLSGPCVDALLPIGVPISDNDKFVHVYYWPDTAQSPHCENQAPVDVMQPPPSLQMYFEALIDKGSFMSLMDDRVLPSIYAVFPSVMASDGCQTIGNTYKDITTSFAPGELSTLELVNGVEQTKVFNPADLACPPARLQLDPGQKHEPLIAPPSFITALDPAFAACVPALSQGVDPPHAVATADSVDGAGGPVRGARDIIPRGARPPMQTGRPA